MNDLIFLWKCANASNSFHPPRAFYFCTNIVILKAIEWNCHLALMYYFIISKCFQSIWNNTCEGKKGSVVRNIWASSNLTCWSRCPKKTLQCICGFHASNQIWQFLIVIFFFVDEFRCKLFFTTGIVHLKIKKLCSSRIPKDIWKKVPIDFNSIFPYYGSRWQPKTGYPRSIKYHRLCSTKNTQTGV